MTGYSRLVSQRKQFPAWQRSTRVAHWVFARVPKKRISSLWGPLHLSPNDRAGPVFATSPYPWLGYRDLVFFQLGSRLADCHRNNSAQLPRWTRDEFSAPRQMVSSCFACFIFIIISIPFDCSDTTRRVAKSMIFATGYNFVLRHVCFFVSRISRQNSLPGSSNLFSSQKLG